MRRDLLELACVACVARLLGLSWGNNRGAQNFQLQFLQQPSHLNTAWGVEICLRAVGRGIAADSVLM